MTTYPDPQLNDSDLELLSAYIDQQLTAADRATLEQRLEHEPALQLALEELRTTVGLLRELPAARPPRSFALDPRSVAPKRSWSFPWMQLGSALIAATLLVVFGFVRRPRPRSHLRRQCRRRPSQPLRQRRRRRWPRE